MPQLQAQKNVIIVAHGNSLRALIMHLEHLSSEEILEREIATGKPLTYVFFDAKMKAVKLGRVRNIL